jgi:hypothetical protein
MIFARLFQYRLNEIWSPIHGALADSSSAPDKLSTTLMPLDGLDPRCAMIGSWNLHFQPKETSP